MNPQQPFAGGDFRKSTFSDPDQDCVEIAHRALAFGVRDSKQADSPVLVFERHAGLMFLRQLTKAPTT
jgi:hypothetical protein